MGHKISKRLIALLTAVIVLAASVIPGGVTVKAENQILTGVIAYINAPMPDDMPSAEVLQCSPHAEVSDCVWYKGTVTKGNFDSATKQTGEFEYGQSYTVRVTINAEEGYEFIEATSVFINGRFAEVDTWNESAIMVYYTFFLPDQLTEFIDYDWRPETHTLKITGNGGLEADLSKGYPPFYGNLNIKNIVMGEGITSLEKSYFGECNNIETIKIPATMTYIGHMYDGITKKGYEVADSNTVYTAKDGSLYSKDATVLYDYVQKDATEFTIPDGVKTIEENAFGKDISLERLTLAGEDLELGSGAICGATIKSIIVEEGVKTLGEQWLEGFEDTEVNIPASVESIVARSFLTSPSIEKIHVADDNPNYLDVDGVLITKDGLLDVYPAGKKDTTYRTPEQVNKIDTYGISNNPYLEKIVLSKEVGSVAGSGIYSLDNLESIVVVNPECKFIADSVKECKSLTYVYATENKSAYNWAMFNGYTPKNITHDLKHITLVPATLEADGTKEYYVCRNCDEQFWDAEAKEAVTPEDEFRIPAVDSVTISASECTVAEFSGSKPTVTVKDADGNVLVSGTDYKVSWPSGVGMGVLDVTVTGQGSYQFEKKLSCTVHPSSTLRLPDNESEYDHGSQTIDLLNKACQIRGDERILIYASAYGLGVIDGLFNIDFKMGNMLLDIDKDGNFDLSISGLADLYKEDDSPMTISVLSTCSVDENCDYTLSDAAKAALQGKTETDYVAPYYGKLSIELSEPCAKGHTYTDVWNKDAAGHWHVCSICDEKEVAQPHVPGQAATATTPQTCTICGYEISPALGEATPAPGEATPTPGSGTPAPGDATPTPGSGTPAPGDATPAPGSGTPAPGDATPAPGSGTPALGSSTPATDNKAPVQKPEDTNEVPVTGKIITYKKAVYKVTGTDTVSPTVEYIKPVGTASKSILVPDTVKSGGITYKVTSIAKNAFKNNKKLSKVIIGKNVTKIGKYAFYGCKKLKNITIKTSKLSGKNIGAKAFKGIHSKAVIKVPKAKLKVYKAVLKKKGTGKGVKVKK